MMKEGTTSLGTTAAVGNSNNDIMDGEQEEEEGLAKEGQVIRIGSSSSSTDDDDEGILPMKNTADDDDDDHHLLGKTKNSTGSKTRTNSSRNNNKKKKIRFRRCNSSPDFDFSSDDYDLPCTAPTGHSAAASMPLPLPTMLRSCLSKDSLDEMVADPDRSEGRWSASSSFSNSNSHDGSNDANSKTNNIKMKRNVSFGHIEIREHPIVLGDHPAVSSGPALSLGWYEPDYNNESTNEDDDALSSDLKMCLEEYEKERQEGGAAPRRTGRHQLVVPKHERQRILQKEAGVTMRDMRQVEVETNKIKKSRYKTKEQEQRKFHQELSYNNNSNNNDFVSKTLDGVWKKIKVISASTTTGIGVSVVGRRGRGHHHKQRRHQQQQERELDDLMHRAALADQIRKDQQRHYERQMKRKNHRQQRQKQERSKNRNSSASGGSDQPPTLPKRDGGLGGGGSAGCGTIDLDQPPTVPRRRGYDDDNTTCTKDAEEGDTNDEHSNSCDHACHNNRDGDYVFDDAVGVDEVEKAAGSPDTTQQVPSSTTKSNTVVEIDDDKPLSPQQQTSPSTTITTPPSLLSPKALSHSTSEPLLVWLSHTTNQGDTASSSSSSTSESDVDEDGDGHHHHHEGLVVNDDGRDVVGMDVAVDDDEPFMF